MAQIQIESARFIASLADEERAKPEPRLDLAEKYSQLAAKILH